MEDGSVNCHLVSLGYHSQRTNSLVVSEKPQVLRVFHRFSRNDCGFDSRFDRKVFQLDDLATPAEAADEIPSWTRAQALNALAADIHLNAHKKGCYDVTKGMSREALVVFLLSRIALIHSDLSGALEAARAEPKFDLHCLAYMNWDIKLADAIIGILDLSVFSLVDIGGAVEAKHEYNKSRPHMHGKNS